jgi:hypothetical protein
MRFKAKLKKKLYVGWDLREEFEFYSKTFTLNAILAALRN